MESSDFQILKDESESQQIEKMKASFLLLKQRLSLTHDLIQQYNDQLKETDRLKSDLSTTKEELAKTTRNYNSSVAKVIELQLENTELRKSNESLKTKFEETKTKICADQRHIQQLTCKIQTLEDKHMEEKMEFEIHKSGYLEEIKTLSQKLIKKEKDDEKGLTILRKGLISSSTQTEEIKFLSQKLTKKEKDHEKRLNIPRKNLISSSTQTEEIKFLPQKLIKKEKDGEKGLHIPRNNIISSSTQTDQMKTEVNFLKVIKTISSSTQTTNIEHDLKIFKKTKTVSCTQTDKKVLCDVSVNTAEVPQIFKKIQCNDKSTLTEKVNVLCPLRCETCNIEINPTICEVCKIASDETLRAIPSFELIELGEAWKKEAEMPETTVSHNASDSVIQNLQKKVEVLERKIRKVKKVNKVDVAHNHYNRQSPINYYPENYLPNFFQPNIMSEFWKRMFQFSTPEKTSSKTKKAKKRKLQTTIQKSESTKKMKTSLSDNWVIETSTLENVETKQETVNTHGKVFKSTENVTVRKKRGRPRKKIEDEETAVLKNNKLGEQLIGKTGAKSQKSDSKQSSVKETNKQNNVEKNDKLPDVERINVKKSVKKMRILEVLKLPFSPNGEINVELLKNKSKIPKILESPLLPDGEINAEESLKNKSKILEILESPLSPNGEINAEELLKDERKIPEVLESPLSPDEDINIEGLLKDERKISEILESPLSPDGEINAEELLKDERKIPGVLESPLSPDGEINAEGLLKDERKISEILESPLSPDGEINAEELLKDERKISEVLESLLLPDGEINAEELLKGERKIPEVLESSLLPDGEINTVKLSKDEEKIPEVLESPLSFNEKTCAKESMNVEIYLEIEKSDPEDSKADFELSQSLDTNNARDLIEKADHSLFNGKISSELDTHITQSCKSSEIFDKKSPLNTGILKQDLTNSIGNKYKQADFYENPNSEISNIIPKRRKIAVPKKTKITGSQKVILSKLRKLKKGNIASPVRIQINEPLENRKPSTSAEDYICPQKQRISRILKPNEEKEIVSSDEVDEVLRTHKSIIPIENILRRSSGIGVRKRVPNTEASEENNSNTNPEILSNIMKDIEKSCKELPKPLTFNFRHLFAYEIPISDLKIHNEALDAKTNVTVEVEDKKNSEKEEKIELEDKNFVSSDDTVKQLRSRLVSVSPKKSDDVVKKGKIKGKKSGNKKIMSRVQFPLELPKEEGATSVFKLLNEYFMKESNKTRGSKGRMSMEYAKMKFVQLHLERLIKDEEWTSQVHNDVTNKITESCTSEIAASCIIDVLSKASKKQEQLDKSHSPPAPLMTRTQQKIVTLIYSLEKSYPSIFQQVQAGIEYKLFRLNHAPELEEIEALTCIFTVLSRIKKDRERVRIFCIDSLYCYYLKAAIVLHTVLRNWPEVLPMYASTNEKLPLCIMHLIMSIRDPSDTFPKILALKKLLLHYYKYPAEGIRSEVLAKECLNAFTDERCKFGSLNIALLLLTKKEGPEWAYNNIIKGGLMQMIIYKTHKSLYYAFDLLSSILRAFPTSDESGKVKDFTEQFCDLLDSGEGSGEQQESVAKALICLSRHYFDKVSASLLKWKPVKDLLPETLQRLEVLFNSRDQNWWRKFIAFGYSMPPKKPNAKKNL